MNNTNILVVIVAFIVAAPAVVIAFITGKLHQMNKHQASADQHLEVMQTIMRSLTTRRAVDESEHKDFSNRIADCCRQNASQDEDIQQLRTQGHLHSNTLQRVDPLFTPYRRKAETKE
jgi:hypothetical protein